MCQSRVGSVALIALLVYVWGIHDFLAITRPVGGGILVVEGWIWESAAVRDAAGAFRQGKYERLVILGAPIGNNAAANGQRTSAELAAARLREFGVDEQRLVLLVAENVQLHNTYNSAVTLRDWLIRSKTETTGIDVFTLGTHARKSLALFTRVLGNGIKIGVVAGTEDTYNPDRWWLSMRGIYVVTKKTLGYLYAVLWPFPEPRR